MSTHNHTAIATGAAANASTFNTPLGALDAAIGNLTTLTTTAKTSAVAALNEIDAALTANVGGAVASDQVLREWAGGEDYELTAVTYDSDGVVTTATAKWPDGSAGTFTTTTKNLTWLAVDAYTISHTASGKTVTQAAVTRDGNGLVTVKPALTVA
jgi:hypothetical protein